MAIWQIRIASAHDVVEWHDPSANDIPSRLHHDGVPHRFIRVPAGTLVELEAWVDPPGQGDMVITVPFRAPIDELFREGETWSWWMLESPGFPPPPVYSTLANSARCRFVADLPGHYAIMGYWAAHGRAVFHLDAARVTP